MYSFKTGLCLHDGAVHVWANGKKCARVTRWAALQQGNLGAYHNGEFLGVLTTGLREFGRLGPPSRQLANRVQAPAAGEVQANNDNALALDGG